MSSGAHNGRAERPRPPQLVIASTSVPQPTPRYRRMPLSADQPLRPRILRLLRSTDLSLSLPPLTSMECMFGQRLEVSALPASTWCGRLRTMPCTMLHCIPNSMAAVSLSIRLMSLWESTNSSRSKPGRPIVMWRRM